METVKLYFAIGVVGLFLYMIGTLAYEEYVLWPHTQSVCSGSGDDHSCSLFVNKSCLADNECKRVAISKGLLEADGSGAF